MDEISIFIQEAESLKKSGNIGDAEKIYRYILNQNPTHFIALCSLAEIAEQNGFYEAALELNQKALAINGNDIQLYERAARLLKLQNRFNESKSIYQTLIAIFPNNIKYLQELGITQNLAGDSASALKTFQLILEKEPDNHSAHNNMGLIYEELGNFPEAIKYLEKALQIQPDFVPAIGNLIGLYRKIREFKKASALAKRSNKIKGDTSIIRYANSLIELCLGNFAIGFREYETRFTCPWSQATNRTYPIPRWNGKPLNGKTLLIWNDQGIGDEIMYGTIFTDLEKWNETIYVQCDKRLVTLFSRSFPQLNFIPHDSHKNGKIPQPLSGKNISFQIPQSSLCQSFRKERSNFHRKNTIQPDPDKVAYFKEKYKKLFPGKKRIGISWKTKNIEMGGIRSSKLLDWQSLFDDELQFINLQYGEVQSEINELHQQTGHKVYNDQEVDPLVDLEDFCAQISSLDLVISIDNSTIHFAGALGIETWALLPYAADWRWFMGTIESEESLWYKSIKLFWQDKHEPWTSLISSLPICTGSQEAKIQQ